MKLNKEESSATDLLGIFLGANVDIGAAEGLGSPSKWSAWSWVLCTQPHILCSLFVCWPFLSNSHLPTVTIVITPWQLYNGRFRRAFTHCYCVWTLNHSCIQQVFECLLWARHLTRYWGHSSEQNQIQTLISGILVAKPDINQAVIQTVTPVNDTTKGGYHEIAVSQRGQGGIPGRWCLMMNRS